MKRRKAARPQVGPKADRPRKTVTSYKVVELSTVDETTLERTLNDWTRQGWTLDGVQFAMRESSKRPSMAFVFFTKEGAPLADDRPRSEDAAESHLRNLAGDQARMGTAVSAWDRLAQLAEEDEEP